jgi:uncharacterized protein
MRSRPLPRARFAALIAVVLLSASLIAVLVACPPSTPPAVETQRPVEPRAGRAAPAPAAPAPAVAAPAPAPIAPAAAPRALALAAAPPEHPRPEPPGMLAVIIDDAGYSLSELQPFLELPGPLTIAVLPNLPNSREAARRVLAAGKDLILHCPMEALGGENAGPGALRTDMSRQEIESLLDQAFASVPGAPGMNNHMGSRATADPAFMEVVLGYLKREGKFYVDSRTTAATVGPQVARSLGVPSLQRDIFVDRDTAAGEIAAAFSRGVGEARAGGSAVLIGHVQTRGVVDILRAEEDGLARQGVRLARLSDVMRQRERDAARENSGDRKLVR